jgi:hypothetical protein
MSINKMADTTAVMVSIASLMRFSLTDFIFNTVENSILQTAIIPAISIKFKSQ